MIFQGLFFIILLWVIYYVALPFLSSKVKSKEILKTYPKKTYSESDQTEFDKELGILPRDDE